MVRGRSRSLLPFAFAVLLLAGGTVLAVLQIGWVNAATGAEEDRARGALALGAARVRMEAEDEIRVLMSLLRVSGADLQRADWAETAEAVAFWYQTARFPLMLRAVYIVSFPLREGCQEYSRENGEFLEASLPPALREAIAAGLDAPTAGYRPASSRPMPDGSILVVVPASGRAAAASPEAAGAVAALVDLHVVYREAVPALMEQHLGGYPFRVVDTVTGEEVVRSARADRSDEPELAVSLDSLTSFEGRFAPPQPGLQPSDMDRGGALVADDPSLRFWLLRGRSDRERLLAAGPTPREGTRVALQIYYPGRSLEAVLRGRRVLGIGVGVGILSILVASAAVLYSLYRRTALLRAGEQEFVASMSHELRTPISVIQAMSGNLVDGVVTDPARLPRYARVIREQTRRLADMVESILFYSGLQANSARAPTLAEVDLKALLLDVSQAMGELAASRGSTVRLVADSAPETICSDATALRLLMENLVTNAIRHADPGEIRISVSRRAFDGLRVTVEDRGPGIPPREQARIFEPFVRGERSVRDQRPGSGLGLHLVKRVAAMLGGSVMLESPYENLAGVAQPGCRFTVTLPFKERCDSDR
jgi:signal transduction histidine kinase